jgi:UDP-glucose 6-dehydrogenase
MAAGEVGGAAAAYAGGSSSSLHKEYKLWTQGKNKAIEELEYNTYDASISKYSISSTRTGALPATAELDEAISSTRFLFLSTPTSSASAGGGDVDELVSSSNSLTSSLS